MPHLDPEQLSLLALYDDWQDEYSREHLGSCGECAADYAALRRAVDAVKTTPDSSSLEAPGPHVWAGIHRELGLSPSLQEDPLAAPQGEAPSAEEALPPARPQSLDEARVSRRRKAAWWQGPGAWLAAAAAVLLVAGGTVWSLNRAPDPVAQAELTPLAQFSATGSAKVLSAADGSRRLEVKLSKDEAQGYQEVWLIAPDLSRLVSLGVMNSDTGTFEVPAGLELADFPIVDVSDEPVDGNPAHSSVSIVRGTLNT
ncbi:anti-sigma factor [Arthrobacter sp. HMWF013]|uniref:anti-sigma factor n=1 Tax=Arthrobacter sp. HMWF013 TaxID=2056849 RepID=UPI000D35544F|nr:anti-sigma factor [Arthrobacter sp. HMWF013]PTT59129.1 anti-sigma factor [Arthrobacter sp. HMWF013]